MVENPQRTHDDGEGTDSAQPSSAWESMYQQSYADYGPSASSSREPDYGHTTDDPPVWGYRQARIDLHLGQKPKLEGRYADDLLIYLSYFVGPLYIHVFLSFPLLLLIFIFLLSKTQEDQKYFRCFSLFASVAF
jgi:hypothetical protein